MIEFEKLDKSKIRLIIEFFLPITPGLIEFLKKKRKLFGNELDGADLKMNSLVLQRKIPNVFSNEIKRKNSVVINFVEKNVGGRLDEINQYIKSKFGSMQNIEKTIQSNREENYIKLLDILLEKMESKYIGKSMEWVSLFLNLNGIYINEQQREMIENSIEKVVELRKIEKRVLKEEEKLEIKYEKELKAIENKFKNENQILSSQILEKERAIENINQMLNEKNEYIDEQQKNYDYLKEKSESLESKIGEIKKELNDNKEKWQQNIIKEKQKNQKLENINEDQNKKIEYLENELNRRYENYSSEYKARWEKENQLVIDKKIYEKNSLKENVRKLKKEIINLNEEKEKSRKRLKEYNGVVSGFINNIDKELIRSALESSVLNIKELQEKENNMQLYIKYQIKCNKMELFNGIDEEEWSNTILDNLKNIGVVEDRYEWSDYIISVLAARMIPLIVGYRTREIAKAISCSYAGETPYIITLSPGYNKVNELIDLYHNSEAKVILIENAIGQMNESLLLPLFKEYVESKEDNKIILLSCEDINMANLIPSYLFEYLALIKISNIRPVVQFDYNYADNMKILQSIRKSKLNIEDSYKKLKRLLEYIEAEDSYIITRSLILAYLCNMEDVGSALKCLSICDLKSMFKDDVREKIGSNIDNYPDYFAQELKESIVGD
ncbi:hypothetical protein ACFHWD_01260 [Clostridium sp. MT-14]|uniref:Chromosome partition protein Smc n=1 Tax=Clostridium aromativorans TaxID=2836848 RepID=A0ABS8N128_9CLOT|nr:hypothetical protein [Clostridium aromativorans]MCC9293501.1 hypothetical protein [Clostridium aromativorans]